MSTSTLLNDAQIISEIISGADGNYDPDAARAILQLKFSDEQLARMEDLADRNNRGELAENERSEMESFRRVGNFLALLQAKARLSLGASESSGE